MSLRIAIATALCLVLLRTDVLRGIVEARLPVRTGLLADNLELQRVIDVASRLKVNEATVCNWETNRTSPQLRFIPRIIAFLGYRPYQPQSDLLVQRIRAQW